MRKQLLPSPRQPVVLLITVPFTRIKAWSHGSSMMLRSVA